MQKTLMEIQGVFETESSQQLPKASQMQKVVEHLTDP